MRSYVRSAVLTGLRELIGDLGGDAAELAREAGIDPAAFGPLDFPVPAAAVHGLYESAAAACGCEILGLLMAERQELDVLGPLWPLIQSAATVQDMLRDLAQYYFLHTREGEISLERDEQGLTIRYDLAVGIGPVDRQIIEMGFALVVRELRKYHPGWMPAETRFRHGPPRELSTHHACFGRTLMFNADGNALTVDAAMLATPLRMRDGETHRALTRHFHRQSHLVPQAQARQTEMMIRTLLPFGPCELVDVAQALRLSERRLQYLLMLDGTSFNRLLDAVRADLAMRYLRQSDLTVGAIAEILGFAETSVLTRACRRWYGVSPRAARTAAS